MLAATATSFALLEVRTRVVALGFLVLSAAFSAMFSGTVAFIEDVTPEARSGEVVGMLWTAFGVGGILGSLLLGVIATLSQYELSFLVGSALAVGVAVIVAAGVKPVVSQENRE